jgi:hypothetical protein
MNKKSIVKNTFIFLSCSIILLSFSYHPKDNDLVATKASMPSATKDAKGIVYIVFANGNRLEYVSSSDNGINFSKPVLVDTIKDLFGVAGRGPHIISTSHTLSILAPDKNGNIHGYTKNENDGWIKNGLVNDVPDVCKEGFVAVAAKGDSLYAVWLDVRNNNRNKIVGALSADGGKTWTKNKIVYQSPDGVVCECCRPSVAFGNNGITVMFRNNWNGNRNLYLIQSHDDGQSFGEAKKLGEGNWKLNACPMDGGSIVINENGSVETVWRRVDTIYSCVPGHQEEMIGKGKNCTVENIGNKNVYAWIEEGNIVCLLPTEEKVNAGEGSFPVLQQINNNSFMCIWQNENNVYKKIISF